MTTLERRGSFSLACCTQVLLQEIGAEQATQEDIALTYAMAIVSHRRGADTPDWRTINAAIPGNAGRPEDWSASRSSHGSGWVPDMGYRLNKGRDLRSLDRFGGFFLADAASTPSSNCAAFYVGRPTLLELANEVMPRPHRKGKPHEPRR